MRNRASSGQVAYDGSDASEGFWPRGPGAPGRRNVTTSIARFPRLAEEAPRAAEPAHAAPEPPASAPRAAEAGAEEPFWFCDPGGIVEDGAATGSGQMTKSEFLFELRAAVEQTAITTLGPTWSLARCEDIPRFFMRQLGKSAAQVEALMKRYGGGRSGDARGLIDAVCGRLPAALRRWASNDAEVSWEPGPSGLPQPLEADAGGDDGGSQRFADPATWGSGAALDGGVRADMESTLGTSLGGVRIHESGALSALASASGVDAVTAGRDVGFAPGAYAPHDPAGKRLLAHEIAHAVQQGLRGAPGNRPIPIAAGTGANEFEDDADHAAESGTAPSLSGGLALRGGNKPDHEPPGGPPREPPKKGPTGDDRAPQIEHMLSLVPPPYQPQLDARLFASQIRSLVQQFVAKFGRATTFSTALLGVIVHLPDHAPLDAPAWNGIIALLVAKKEELYGKKMYSNTQGDAPTQLYLELISALGSKLAPKGGQACPYPDVFPGLLNPEHDEAKPDKNHSPFLDEHNYVHDVEKLAAHFNTTKAFTNPKARELPFSEADQIKLLRFTVVRNIFEALLDALPVDQICPSMAVVQCIVDMGCALRGGELVPNVKRVAYSTQSRASMAEAKKNRGGGEANEYLYHAARMYLLHEKLGDLKGLLAGACKRDRWILDVKFEVNADSYSAKHTIDECVMVALQPTDAFEFTAVCNAGIGTSMIEWADRLLARQGAKGKADPFDQLRQLMAKADAPGDGIRLQEVFLPREPKYAGRAPSPVAAAKPSAPPPEQPSGTSPEIVTSGFEITKYFAEFKFNNAPVVEPGNRDRHHVSREGGTYYLAKETGGPYWGKKTYVFRWVGVASDDDHDAPAPAAGPQEEWSPALEVKDLLRQDRLADAVTFMDADLDDAYLDFCATCIGAYVQGGNEQRIYTLVNACANLTDARRAYLLHKVARQLDRNRFALLISCLKDLGWAAP